MYAHCLRGLQEVHKNVYYAWISKKFCTQKSLSVNFYFSKLVEVPSFCKIHCANREEGEWQWREDVRKLHILVIYSWKS